jgi:large subunit ribosomal protein L14e
LPRQALIDGPENITGVRREVIALKWLALTDIKVGAARNARAKSLTAAWEKEGALAKWTGSAWAKKIAAKAAKANSTDFQRLQAKVKKQTLRKAVAKKLKVRA